MINWQDKVVAAQKQVDALNAGIAALVAAQRQVDALKARIAALPSHEKKLWWPWTTRIRVFCNPHSPRRHPLHLRRLEQLQARPPARPNLRWFLGLYRFRVLA